MNYEPPTWQELRAELCEAINEWNARQTRNLSVVILIAILFSLFTLWMWAHGS